MLIGFGCNLFLWRDLSLYSTEVDIDHGGVAALLDNTGNNLADIRREFIDDFGIFCGAHPTFNFLASDTRDQIIKTLGFIHNRAGIDTCFVKERDLNRDIASVTIKNSATLWLCLRQLAISLGNRVLNRTTHLL